MLERVTMNAGMPTYATQNPCQAPISAPSTRQATTARNHGTSHLVIMIAEQAPTKAATDPTDRSMWPATITITMPMARIRIWAFCTTRFETLSGLSSTPSVVTWNRTTIAASAMIIPYWRMLPRRMCGQRAHRSTSHPLVMYRIRDSWVASSFENSWVITPSARV